MAEGEVRRAIVIVMVEPPGPSLPEWQWPQAESRVFMREPEALPDAVAREARRAAVEALRLGDGR